jgi:hypothetical protein
MCIHIPKLHIAGQVFTYIAVWQENWKFGCSFVFVFFYWLQKELVVVKPKGTNKNFKIYTVLYFILFHVIFCKMVIFMGYTFRNFTYIWLSLSRFRLTQISGWVEFLSKSRTSLCINIYNLTPVESNSYELKFRLSRIKVLVPRCRKPYYLHSLSQIYLSKHVYYLRIKIESQVKHPVIEFDIFTLGYFTCLFHNLSN